MFRLATTRTFEWPVEVRLPSAAEPGAMETHGFIATFESIPIEEAERIEKTDATTTDAGSRLVHGQVALIRRVMTGWRDVVDETGNQVAFSVERLAAACAEPWFRNAVIGAYAQALRGEAARRKN